MRLATVATPAGGSLAVVETPDGWLPLSEPDVGALIRRDGWRASVEEALKDPSRPRLPFESAELLRPVLAPSKILCCGLNYRDHIIETGRETPEHPTLFAKFPDTLTDPMAAIDVDGSERVDWEGELAVVVGSELRRGDREAAAAAILGYTIANDVSMRDWQARSLQWLQGKAWERSTPIGPVVVTADEISPSDGLEIRTLIGDEVVQHSNTRELLFDSAELVSYVSQFTVLRPGDLVLTGTPSGVGLGRQPQRWLRDGDMLTTSIEGIGVLRNSFSITSDRSPA